MISERTPRRVLLMGGTMAAVSIFGARIDAHASGNDKRLKDRGQVSAKEVGAVEDLMREHGVLRRVFLVYRECAGRLRLTPASVDTSAIRDAAQLFRSFGEDYHERKLEEANIFPTVRKLGGEVSAYIDKLIAQHNRGREVTDYILSATGTGKIGAADVEPLARAFDAFEVMYANHTAREDTIVFPAWKETLSAQALAEMGDKFEEIERSEFGHDGFEDAVKRIERIERQLGFADIAQFTSPAPRGAP